MIPLGLKAYKLVKGGNTDQEYEDAAAYDLGQARFAVADGASEASFSGLWAKILTDEFVFSYPPGRRSAKALKWLTSSEKRWYESVPWSRLHSYFVEEKAKMGAFATFLGLSFASRPGDRGVDWHAVAIGDSCLFHVRGGTLVKAFPVTHSSHFGNCPALLPSIPGKRPRPLDRFKWAWGACEASDLFFLATDAVAQWCLRSLEAGAPPWARLRDFKDGDDFRTWVGALREDRQMRNDDVSVLVVEVQDVLAGPV